jgi:recombinational DNA repair protein (RecF pathway)
MHEYVTNALVLGRSPRGEWNLAADLLTEELGRIEARVVGGARLLSKFSRHLDPGNRCLVRVVAKNAMTLTDIGAHDRRAHSALDRTATARMLETIFLLRALLPRHVPDAALWSYLETTHPDPAEVLSILGYDPRHARCGACGNVPVAYFALNDHVFACTACGVQFPEDEVVLLA